MQSSSRAGAKVVWLGIHTTEGIMRARDLLAWKTWAGSSHASNDETGVLLTPADGFVPYDRAAWTLRAANPISDNLEQCGWARWTRPEWLARPKLLETTAQWLADRHRARPWIPLRRLSAAEIRARVPGVVGHGDYSAATGDGTHWDPGPGYPWDVVLARANQIVNGGGVAISQEDDMFSDDDRKALEFVRNWILYWGTPLAEDGKSLQGPSSQGELMTRIRQTHVAVAALAGRSADIDEEKLAAALAPTLVPAVLGAVQTKAGLTKDDVEAAIREVLGSLGQAG